MTTSDKSSSRNETSSNAPTYEAASLVEALIRSLLKGQYSSATLSFNEQSAPSYSSVAEEEDENGKGLRDWVNQDEKERGCATNSKWTLQWYPDTPTGFCALSASSLSALLAAVAAAQQDEQQ